MNERDDTGRMRRGRSFIRHLGGGGEASAQGVFGDVDRDQEVFEVVGAAGFAADAAQFEAAEGLATDECPRDRAVEIEVADDELPALTFTPQSSTRR